MGTRYHISLANMKKLVNLGLATIGEIEPFYKQEYSEEDNCYMDTDIVKFYVHNGSIGKWAFDAYSENGVESPSMLFSGPNIGKNDLEAVFKEHGIDVNYS